MSRLPIFAVLLELVLLILALAAQIYRSTPMTPAAAAPAATSTPRQTATPVPSAAIPPVWGAALCPTTQPPNSPFVPPKPWPAQAPYGGFWYGTPALWTALYSSGIWSALPHNPEGYTQKIILWPYGGEQPTITVTGKRLDGPARPYTSPHRGTNACHSDFGGCVMLTSVDLPLLGCWELTIEYAGDTLHFVVWVGQ